MTNSEIDFSVCIANFNGAELLDACLGSIKLQVTQANIEILVHDDASIDPGLKLVREKYHDVVWIFSTENVGYCQANQKMSQQARGKYLLLLNNDVELLPEALERLFLAVREDPSPIYSLREYRMDGRLSCSGMGLDVFFTPFHCTKPSHKLVYAMGACLMIRKELWQELGGYPTFFKYSAEDLYLCLKARALGISTQILDMSGYRHHISATTNSAGINLARRRLSERNRRWILQNMVIHRHKILIYPGFTLMRWLENLFHVLTQSSLRPLSPLPQLQTGNEPRQPVLHLLTWRPSKLLHFIKPG